MVVGVRTAGQWFEEDEEKTQEVLRSFLGSVAVNRGRSFGELMGSSENIYTGKVQGLAGQEKSAGAVLAGKGHALNWSRGHHTMPAEAVLPCQPRADSSP